MFKRILPCLLLSATLLSAAACDSGDTAETTPAVSDDTAPATVDYDFTDCKVIYSASANTDVTRYAERVRTQLRSATLQEISLETDASEAAVKEILVGDTNRPESAEVKAKLPADAGHAYRIELVGDKFVIVATDDVALETAVQCFIYDVVKEIRDAKLPLASDYCYADSYGSSTLLFSSGVQMKTQLVTTIYGPTDKQNVTNLSYGRIIELAHNGAYNGVLLATSESLDVEKYLIHRSTDFGQTWEQVGAVTSQMKNLVANWQPMLYELPCQVGDMAEGTILLAGCVRNSDTTKTNMVIYKSTDFGSSWKLVSTVDSADGFSTTGGLSKGLWEPFLMCDDDGKLWCFYSDEKEAETHSQKLVCRYSTDGVSWSETQDVVAADNQSLRPGMITVTRLGDGRYLATYEIVGMSNNPIYFKITDDLTDWNPSDIGEPVVTKRGEGFGSAPHCVWTPAGGKCGTLIVAAMFNYNETDEKAADLLVSFDYGETWTAIENPLYYKTNVEARYAYSPGFFASADGKKIFYVNTVPAEAHPGKQDLKLAILEISEFGGIK
ncbi:MAG: exo-alpha-sialidase [Clostridia bacterium]|nr:exo-alpha-sialidase [Clostridia bacterium]